MELYEILNHLGEDRHLYFNAVSPPVIQSSNFAFSTLEDFRMAFSNELANHIYTRGNNPTVEILRKKVAALEGAEDALVTASGIGAISAAVLSQVKKGDHIVCVAAPYSWTRTLIQDYLPKFGVTHTFINGADLQILEASIQPNTSLLYLESPNSLTFELQDLAACAQIAKKYKVTTCIDNSYTSPLYQNPIHLGIDIVVHSASKYLNGHSDVVAGVICSSKEIIARIFRSEIMILGSIISPHDASLILRGLRTLPIRLERSNESALKIASALEKHPKIKQVLHPHLPSFPQFELAKKQMRGCGGLFSLYLNCQTLEETEVFINSLKRFTMAVSWGGHESLILPVAGFYKVPGKADSKSPFNLIRFYVGLEDPDWLLEDLYAALERF